MSNSPLDPVYCELNTIHKVITRGIRVSLENVKKYRTTDFPNPRTKKGFIDYVRSLILTLDNHHYSEDDIAFPVYQKYAPEAPYQLLATEHHNMLSILNEMKAVLGHLDNPATEAGGLDSLQSSLSALEELWNPHINCEEGHFCAHSLLKSIPEKEQVQIGKKISAHAIKNSKPLSLSLPFLLYNLPVEERALFSQGIPKLVTGFLVPVVWRRKWMPMKPFLIH